MPFGNYFFFEMELLVDAAKPWQGVGVIFLSDFADLGLVLPLALSVALSLALVGQRRQALAWSLVVAGTLGTMLLLKVSVFAFGRPAAGLVEGLANPSGHTAAGVVVYTGLLALLLERFAAKSWAVVAAGAALSTLFGSTRVAMQVHTLADVAVGAAVGMAGGLVLAKLSGMPRRNAPVFGNAIVAAVALITVVAFHGHRLNVEADIQWIAAEVSSAIKL